MAESSPARIVLASANSDKAAEITAILAVELKGAVELLPRPSWVAEVEETGTTLEQNARLKADALRNALGIAAVSDDTGLEVAALMGEPGVRSARYAGERASYTANLEKLLANLQGVENRVARFRTVALIALPGGGELVATGVVEGVIAATPRGEGGFGYDPVFVPDEGDGRSFAEMTAIEKHAISHRGRAFRALARLLATVPGGPLG